jgi:hyperosmotically inducible periplasmic protein
MNKFILASILAASGGAFTGCAAPEGQLVASPEDEAITARVQDRLAQDPAVNSGRITVETINGKVQLSGFANNQGEKNRAGALASRIADVKDVNNNVLVYEPGE